MTGPGEQPVTLAATALPTPAKGGAPEWVHLIPAGDMQARDGRRFWLSNPRAVVLNSIDPKADLPIDYEHQSETPDKRSNGPIPAAGWIKQLEARADGIWGRVTWTERAAAMIAAREYRYLSPTLIVRPGDKSIVRLRSAGGVGKTGFITQRWN
jgi:phage I-like protein